MNLLDLALIIVIVVSVLLGAYRGFVVSALKTASFFVSWILAYLLHPLLSWAMSGQGMMQTLINYTDGHDYNTHYAGGCCYAQRFGEQQQPGFSVWKPCEI